MHSQMSGDRTLRIAVFLNGLGDLPVALLPVLQNARREYLVQSRPVRVPLAPRDVGDVLMLPQMIDQPVGKGFLAQQRLPPHLVPDGLADAPADELPVFFLCNGPLSAELAQDPFFCQAGMACLSSRRGPVAAPLPRLGYFHHICSDRIEDDVPADLEQMAVLLNEDGLVPTLEEMTGSAVQSVKELRIHAVQLPHAERKISVRRLNEEVIVVVHQTVGVTDPVVTLVNVWRVFRKLRRSWSDLKTGFLSLPREVT